MINVKKVIDFIEKIQESAATILSLRKSLDASMEKETKDIKADAQKAIAKMKD